MNEKIPWISTTARSGLDQDTHCSLESVGHSSRTFRPREGFEGKAGGREMVVVTCRRRSATWLPSLVYGGCNPTDRELDSKALRWTRRIVICYCCHVDQIIQSLCGPHTLQDLARSTAASGLPASKGRSTLEKLPWKYQLCASNS